MFEFFLYLLYYLVRLLQYEGALPKEAGMDVPFVTAVLKSVIYKEWESRYSLVMFFEDKAGVGDLICVIKISVVPPWTPPALCKKIHGQVPTLLEELKSCGFEVQLLGKEYPVGTHIYVKLY